ncbi:hypothetical protein FC96_GL002305 [Secundilactobacillus kimchicus JCM 15530]|uniref:Uncharacterized protein n=1 Tax=Secundilactobacillus kimchicus JCM 15530 TaxID=1302272 RepID=A0A0R1HLF2_9LACO|nr:phage holin, LLH family [Secundilactobacillus kimchicus]KRK47582.1 hypothetical protein FC96_GL002305 [Secundilactobacillus kimchicus JCM 15530]
MFNGTIDYASGISFLLIVIPATYRLLHPLIQAKINTEKNAQTKQEMALADHYAQVAEMAVMANLSKADRKNEAVRFLMEKMLQRGFAVSDGTAHATVEAAYQDYKHQMGGDIHTIQTPTHVAADPDVSVPGGDLND